MDSAISGVHQYAYVAYESYLWSLHSSFPNGSLFACLYQICIRPRWTFILPSYSNSTCVLSLGTLLLLVSDFRHFILMIFASVTLMTTKYSRRNACPSKVREMSSVVILYLVWFSYIRDAGKIFCSQQVCGSGIPTALVLKSQVPSLDMRKQQEKPTAPHLTKFRGSWRVNFLSKHPDGHLIMVIRKPHRWLPVNDTAR